MMEVNFSKRMIMMSFGFITIALRTLDDEVEKAYNKIRGNSLV